MNVDEQVRNRRAIEALRNGVPNGDAVTVLGCNQPEIEEKFRSQLQKTKQAIADGGKNEGIMIAGEFGAGKSHLLEYLMHLAVEQNFVCSKVVISKETPLFDPLKLYRAAVGSAVVPGKRGSVMTLIAHGLKFNSNLYADFYQWIHQKAALNSRFAASLFLFERMPNDPELRDRIIRYWSGDKMGAGEIKKYLKACREPVTYKIDSITGKELALQSFKFAARLIMAAGYSGWVLLIDEVELVSRYSLMQRAKSYAELARWMGKLEESNYAGLAVVSSITADFQSKVLEGIDDFEKVPGRLRAKGTESDLLLASQAERGMRVIQNELARLKAPDSTTLDQTYEKVRSIHAKAYDWNPPPVPSVERLGSTRMRQYIRGWITEWDLKRLDREYNPEIEVGIVEQDYSEDKNLEVETEGNETNSTQE
ncbi:MAG: BREX system ATP-binding domain-containing protein [Syntrophales bacterium]